MNGTELTAHWPLGGDARDAAGGHHGSPSGAAHGDGPDGSPRGAALFNGRDSAIRVPDAEALRFGNRDFSAPSGSSPNAR